MADVEADQDWEIVPFERVGPLVFGASREHVVRVLGEPDDVLDEEPIRIEAYDDVQPGYDRGGHLVAVHTGPGRAVVYRDIRLTDRSVRGVEEDLRAVGVHVAHDEDGALVLPDLGIEFFAEELGYEPGTVQGVFVKARDYSSAASSPTP